MDYETLNAMAPEEFLFPERFATRYDQEDDYAQQQYERGVRLSGEWDEIYIRHTGTWGARRGKQVSEAFPDREPHWSSECTSYEGIGYHRSTADLLRGFLAGPAPVYVERRTENGIVKTQIK
ncbi:hypothetical protein ABZ470_23745 [Streptosporangium sp. NPDC020072]|uniref:hypothetical protein n=1 Tax=Streptosporangium sp. NPDC020072 TaxID=3154788 RepID=UPI003415F100